MVYLTRFETMMEGGFRKLINEESECHAKKTPNYSFRNQTYQISSYKRIEPYYIIVPVVNLQLVMHIYATHEFFIKDCSAVVAVLFRFLTIYSNQINAGAEIRRISAFRLTKASEVLCRQDRRTKRIDTTHPRSCATFMAK